MKKLLAIALIATTLLSCNNTDKKQTTQDNRAEIVTEFYKIFDSGKADQLNTIASENLIDHDASNPNVSGLEGLKGLILMINGSFSNVNHSLDQMYPIGNDMYFVRWTMTGKHTGDFFGVPASNKDVSFNGHDVFKFENGKITENWHVEELLNLMGQISPQQ